MKNAWIPWTLKKWEGWVDKARAGAFYTGGMGTYICRLEAPTSNE